MCVCCEWPDNLRYSWSVLSPFSYKLFGVEVTACILQGQYWAWSPDSQKFLGQFEIVKTCLVYQLGNWWASDLSGCFRCNHFPFFSHNTNLLSKAELCAWSDVVVPLFLIVAKTLWLLGWLKVSLEGGVSGREHPVASPNTKRYKTVLKWREDAARTLYLGCSGKLCLMVSPENRVGWAGSINGQFIGHRL